MNPIIFTPHPALRPYIHHYLFFEIGDRETWSCTSMTPPGCAALTLTIGRQKRFIGENDRPASKYEPAVFVGQTTRFKKLFIYDRLQCFFVIFRPCGVYPLLGVHQGKCRNECISLTDLLGSSVRLFEDEFMQTTSGEGIQVVVEKFFLKSLNKSRRYELKKQEDSIRMASVVRKIGLQSHHCSQIKAVCREEGYSISRLERHMRKIVGLSPKQFQRIVRFNKVLQYIRQNRSNCNWSQIASRFGYYDQTHFIKEFKHFYGKTPSEQSINDRYLGDITLQQSRL